MKESIPTVWKVFMISLITLVFIEEEEVLNYSENGSGVCVCLKMGVVCVRIGVVFEYE